MSTVHHSLSKCAGTGALGPRANRILASLATDAWHRWQPALKPTYLERGQGLPGNQAFFPTTATVSLISSSSSGDATEVATVGNDGLIGVALLTGGGTPFGQAEVTGSGHGYALSGTTLRDEFFSSGATMALLLRYVQALMAQAMQQAVCVQHHSVEQRLCRCLLDGLDRKSPARTLELTHQTIGLRLGVRRETVTACALRLQSLGAISYRLGVITVHDRKLLQACSCECYSTVRNAYDRLLPTPGPLEPCDSAPPSLAPRARSLPPVEFAARLVEGAARAMHPASLGLAATP